MADGNAVCTVPGCDREMWIKKRGWCQTHYNRWYWHGDVLWVPKRKPRPRLMCSECGKAMRSGTQSAKQGQNTCMPCRRSRANGYRSAHGLVARRRGRAKDQQCERCGKPAEHWAYDHTDPDEVTEFVPGEGGGWRTYSLDPARYIPLCRSCHYEFDEKHRDYVLPEILTRPVAEWSLDELGRGHVALMQYIHRCRAQAGDRDATQLRLLREAV